MGGRCYSAGFHPQVKVCLDLSVTTDEFRIFPPVKRHIRESPSASYALSNSAFTFLRQFAELVRKRYLSRDMKADMHAILAEYFLGQWSKGQLRPILLPSLSMLLNADRKVLFKVTKLALCQICFRC